MARRSGVERLWSPWRMGYVRRAAEPAGCIFCRTARTRTDRASLVVLRRPNALVMPPGLLYFQARLGYEVVNLRLAFPTIPPT